MPRRARLGRLSAVVLATLGAAACAVRAPGPPGPGAPTLGQLANAEYPGIGGKAVRLRDGRYEGPAFVRGGASRPTVTLLREPVAFADLDADGIDEALVLLVEEAGGSGSFVFLAVAASRGGEAVVLDALRLGDRVEVHSVTALGDGNVRVTMLTHGPDDPACCPTQLSSRDWALRGGALVPAGEAPGR